MEKTLVRKMNQYTGFGGDEGIMCTGGSNANMLAIHCARSKDDPEAYFHGNKKDYVIFVSENAHYSFEKAVNLMGLGLNSIVLVKNDEHGRIIPNELDKSIEEQIKLGKTPLMVATTFGTTVMGAFDPAVEIDKVAKKHQLWHHVDGAWGGSALLSKTFSHLTNGVELADSFTWDAHKLMGTGAITSFFLAKHKGCLKEANSTKGGEKYIFHEYENRDYDTGPDSLQCGRKVDSLKLYLNWAYLGEEGYANYMDNLKSNADYFIEKLKQHPEKFKLIHEPTFLNVCFQIIPSTEENINEFNFKKRFELVREGFFQTNFSKNPDGTIFFRHIFANNKTQKKDIDLFVERLLSIQ
jgi:glutamate/tyrosine decarboxylase-like PLP-dependent enzyme